MGGSGGGGMGGFMTGRATADLLTRTTAILAASFMATSVVLAILADSGADQGSILDQLQRNSGSESEEQAPSVPLAE